MSRSVASRRRSVPWIQRWSRVLIGAIAVLGMINTGYLTISRLTSSATACPSGGCEQVLSSPYATVFGLPLALFGLLAYTSMAIFALGPLAINAETQKQLRSQLENWTWPLLFAGATAMLVFSGYLMNIMFSQFVVPYGAKGICYYCLASAIFALSLFVLTLVGRVWEDIGQLFMVGAVVAIVTLVGTLGVYSSIGKGPGYNITSASGQVAFTVTETSGPAEIELARHLKQTGAIMYGAFWCSHCYSQKKVFGIEAINDIPYIECAPEGKNPQTELCQTVAAKAEKQTGKSFGFPTWEINGKYFSGQQSLEDLATASGYKGPRNFKNSL